MQVRKISIGKHMLFWFAATLISLLLIYALSEILLPFIMGLAIAYFLDPLVDQLNKIGISRLWGAIIIVACFLIVFVGVLVILIPVFVNELAAFAAQIPEYTKRLKAFYFDIQEQWFGALEPEDKQRLQTVITGLAEQLARWGATTASSLVSGSFALFNFLSLLLITPVVTFYLLKDWDKIVAIVEKSLPRDHADTIRGLASEVNTVMAGFVRGQVTVLLLLGIFYIIGMKLVGLNFGILIGLTAGLISFIPFVGSIVGFLLAVSVALVQFLPDWMPVIMVVAIFFTGQILEGNFLSPKIVGDSVKLHPVWLIFALFVFGYLLGFLGLIIAVPVAAAIGVLVRFGFDQYRESEFYLGKGMKQKGDAS